MLRIRLGRAGLFRDRLVREVGGLAEDDALATAIAVQLLLQQLRIDRERGHGTLRGGHDRELDVAGCVARDVEAGDGSLLVAVGLDAALARQRAAEPVGEVGGLVLTAVEK